MVTRNRNTTTVMVCALVMSGATLIGCASTSTILLPAPGGITTFMTSTHRMSPELVVQPFAKQYFQREWDAICVRRSMFSTPSTTDATLKLQELKLKCVDQPKPAKVVGLALSGGGIRSNAFHLGMLSGLSEARLLPTIDYISAVSGGSWAAAAYKTNSSGCRQKDTGKFLSKETDEEYFKRVDEAVKTGRERVPPLLADYAEIMAEVKKSVWFVDLFDMNRGFTVREAWRGMLVKEILQGCDLPLQDVEELNPSRPVTIFNLTHDGMSAAEKSFPFEMTSYAIGTVADCGNTDYCEQNAPQFIAHRNDVGVFWEMQTSVATGTVNTLLYGLRPEQAPPLLLSHAIAMSSGVIPRAYGGYLRWKLRFPRSLEDDAGAVERKWNDPGINYFGYRNEYELTDGGHSENLGAFSLIERGVDLIILSDSDFDPDYTLGDFETLKSHAHRLLGAEFNVDVEDFTLAKDIAYEGPSLFKESEFTEGRNPELLMQTLWASMPNLRLSAGKTAVEMLNDVLKNPGLYNELVTFYLTNTLFWPKWRLTKDAESLIRETEFYRSQQYDELWGYQQKRIVKMNRLILESAFPTLCPKSVFPLVHGNYKGQGKKGKFLLIKPPKFLDDFKRYLLVKQYDKVYNYLEFNSQEISFPMDATIKLSYAPTLIHAYYLLGQYLATCVLVPELQELQEKEWKAPAECRME